MSRVGSEVAEFFIQCFIGIVTRYPKIKRGRADENYFSVALNGNVFVLDIRFDQVPVALKRSVAIKTPP
jgi:hypothetical protein